VETLLFAKDDLGSGLRATARKGAQRRANLLGSPLTGDLPVCSEGSEGWDGR
jgi:hypothetical protein